MQQRHGERCEAGNIAAALVERAARGERRVRREQVRPAEARERERATPAGSWSQVSIDGFASRSAPACTNARATPG
jgi:hypothetical protein